MVSKNNKKTPSAKPVFTAYANPKTESEEKMLLVMDALKKFGESFKEAFPQHFYGDDVDPFLEETPKRIFISSKDFGAPAFDRNAPMAGCFDLKIKSEVKYNRPHFSLNISVDYNPFYHPDHNFENTVFAKGTDIDLKKISAEQAVQNIINFIKMAAENRPDMIGRDFAKDLLHHITYNVSEPGKCFVCQFEANTIFLK